MKASYGCYLFWVFELGCFNTKCSLVTCELIEFGAVVSSYFILFFGYASALLFQVSLVIPSNPCDRFSYCWIEEPRHQRVEVVIGRLRLSWANLMVVSCQRVELDEDGILVFSRWYDMIRERFGRWRDASRKMRLPMMRPWDDETLPSEDDQLILMRDDDDDDFGRWCVWSDEKIRRILFGAYLMGQNRTCWHTVESCGASLYAWLLLMKPGLADVVLYRTGHWFCRI